MKRVNDQMDDQKRNPALPSLKSLFCAGLVVLVSAASIAAPAAPPERDAQNNLLAGRDMRHEFHFKKPLVIPFELFSDKQKQDLNQGASIYSRTFWVVFINGKPTRVQDYGLGPWTESFGKNANVDYHAAVQVAVDKVRKKLQRPDLSESDAYWSTDGLINVTYCTALLNLTGEHNDDGYVHRISQPLITYKDSNWNTSPLSFNIGTLTEEVFGFYRDLAPSERPNEATGRARSTELPMVSCLRHAKGNEGARVRDLIEAIGKETVEMHPYVEPRN